MGLESANFISGLNASNPINATDVVGQGDDHLRLIKSTLLNTFPNITGAMSLTHTQLNNAAIKTEANQFTAQYQELNHTAPQLRFAENDQGANAKNWLMTASAGVFEFRIYDDAWSANDVMWRARRTAATALRFDFLAETRIYDSGETDYIAISHDGTNALLDFANTTYLNLQDGIKTRWFDSTNVDSFTVYHDGTDAHFEVISGTGEAMWTGWTSVRFRDGCGVRVYDSTDADYMQFAHDGTNANVTFLGTTHFDIEALAAGGGLRLRSGNSLYLSDASNVDSVRMYHDGTDLNLVGINTGRIVSDTDIRINKNNAAMELYEADAGADGKLWAIRANGNELRFQARTDADGAGEDAIVIARTGTNSDSITLLADSLVTGDAILTTDNLDAQEPGFKGAPKTAKSLDYTLALTDAGTMIYLNGGASKTLTIPANASVAFPVGTIIEIINDSGNSWTIAITTDTLEKYGGSTGSKTLTDNNKAVIEKVTTTKWKYSSTD